MASSLIENLLGEDLETRMPYLLAQFPEHTEDSIRDLAQYDPSGQAKFITWILRVLRQQGGGLTPEAGQQVRSALERFNRVKNYPMFQGKKDINQYTDFEDLFATMAEAEQVMSKAEQVKKGMERVAQWKDYTLWRVNNAAAAKKFAQNSSLCFCDEPHATNYTVAQQGQPRTGPPLFGVTKGNDKVAALHPNSNQYHDMQNRPVSGRCAGRAGGCQSGSAGPMGSPSSLTRVPSFMSRPRRCRWCRPRTATRPGGRKARCRARVRHGCPAQRCAHGP